jgi:beta-lactamase class D
VTTRSICIVAWLVALVAGALATPPAATAADASAECVVIGVLGAPPTSSDAAECARPTAPASTFKIPHALIALQTGVVTPATVFEWDGTTEAFDRWQRSHTVESAIRWSVLPFFQRAARLIGRDRMRQGLTSLAYAADTFDGDLSTFWLTGDLAVTPLEQYAFLQRFFARQLPVDAAHLDTVRRALTMTAGQVTNASGSHAFALGWTDPVTVRIKTGNTAVNDERVSWAVGAVESRGRDTLVVARVRSSTALDGTAGLDAARRALDGFPGRSERVRP